MTIKEIAMITKNDCPSCKDAVEWFEGYGIKLYEFNINTHPSKRILAKLYRMMESPGLPLILVRHSSGEVEQIVGNRTDRFEKFLMN